MVKIIKIISILFTLILVYISIGYSIQCTRQATFTPGDPCSQVEVSSNAHNDSVGLWIVIAIVGYLTYKHFSFKHRKFRKRH